jgi:glutamate carboxypeptidase
VYGERIVSSPADARVPLQISAEAAAIAPRAREELARLVGISSPSGDREGSEAALALCASLLPQDASVERVPCSTSGGVPDLIARIHGAGRRRIMLLGHVDTVISHDQHRPLECHEGRLRGSGAVDMKGGVILSLLVAEVLAARARDSFAELAILLVTDEEWRTEEFAHAGRFPGWDACLCFEAGELTSEREEAVIVTRKGAGTLRVRAVGRAAHSGTAPQNGVNALLALCEAALRVGGRGDPDGADRLTVTPTIIHSGSALNVVPAAGELIVDLRATRTEAFEAVRAAVPERIGAARLEAVLERVWPAMDSAPATERLLDDASELLGRPILARGRGGASDASHFATGIPLTVDGLGPRGGAAHAPEEFVWADSLRTRAEVALAVALAALGADP